ncbi:MAG: arylsulfatase [Bacteroidia bacterium]|nr:arylsulfatase [Bacteroidia bacterium]
MQLKIRTYISLLFSFFVSISGFSKETETKIKAEKNNKPEKPNIIMILADDMGYSDLGCYGGEINTPNLDKLAHNGIRFTQMHNTAKCFPSRACLLTGVYAQQSGMSQNPDSFKNTISIGDLLRTVGYRTFLSGKNHSKTSLYNFGFDRVYEFWGGATNHFNPGEQRMDEPVPIFKGGPDTWNIDDKSYHPYTPPKDFYSTDYFTKYAISFLDEYKSENKPFFLYLAYTAPHDPLMAWPEDIAKYRGKYKAGYKTIRDARYKKMLELGMVDQSMKLSEQTAIDWESLTEEEKDQEDLRMSIYAAMIDRIDQNIGKLLKKLEETGKLDNTLILFASDNGACAENAEGNIKNPKGTGEPGTLAYWASLKENWANVCNTPYRYYKNSSYEGGICTPFIAWWPKKIRQEGTINTQPLHFVDILATFKDITGASYPTHFRNQEIVPMQGESFLPALKGETIKERQKPIFWQWAKGKAIRVGNWKAVAISDVWALYDMQTDRNETNDLKAKYPDKFQELVKLYDEWATKNVPTVGPKEKNDKEEKKGKKEKTKTTFS